jgi:hypothetical protein
MNRNRYVTPEENLRPLGQLQAVSRQIPKLKCPECGELLDGCTGVGTHKEELIPCDGDNTTCVYCGYWLQFKDGGLVYGTAEQFEQLHPGMRKLVAEFIEKPIRIKA